MGEIKIGGKTKICTIGLAINIASRIQKMTKKLNNSLLVSQETIGDAQTMEVKLEGVTAPVLVYLLGKPYASPRYSYAQRLSPSFYQVGREINDFL